VHLLYLCSTAVWDPSSVSDPLSIGHIRACKQERSSHRYDSYKSSRTLWRCHDWVL